MSKLTLVNTSVVRTFNVQYNGVLTVSRIGKNKWFLHDKYTSNWLLLAKPAGEKLEGYYQEWLEDTEGTKVRTLGAGT